MNSRLINVQYSFWYDVTWLAQHSEPICLATDLALIKSTRFKSTSYWAFKLKKIDWYLELPRKELAFCCWEKYILKYLLYKLLSIRVCDDTLMNTGIQFGIVKPSSKNGLFFLYSVLHNYHWERHETFPSPPSYGFNSKVEFGLEPWLLISGRKCKAWIENNRK